MKFINLNKYILQEIFSHIEKKRRINLVIHNKDLMNKLEITKYLIQKIYFYKTFSPFFTDGKINSLNSKIFDESTFKKLKTDYYQDSTEIYQEKNFFSNKTDEEIIEKIRKIPKLILPQLEVLNLDNLTNFTMPCNILFNLSSLSLENMINIKILFNDESEIFLKNLKYLYLNNVCFDRKQKIKIIIPNLIYLDIRFHQNGERENEDNENESMEIENNESFNDNSNSNSKSKMTIFDIMEQFIDIFGFNFLSFFLVDKKQLENDIYELYSQFMEIFKNPDDLFQAKYLKNLNFLNIMISIDYYYEIQNSVYSNNDEENSANSVNDNNNELKKYESIYNYIFSKTKNDKYLFKTKSIKNLINDNEISQYNINKEEIRYCESINYNKFYFKNKIIDIQGCPEDALSESLKLKNDDLNTNFFKIGSNVDNSNEEYFNDFMYIFDQFNYENNTLEVIYLDILNIEPYPRFIYNMKKFKRLKSFIIEKDCLLNNEELIELLTALSNLKTVIYIEISFQRKINWINIIKLFPNINIQISENKSYLEWLDNNFEK